MVSSGPGTQCSVNMGQIKYGTRLGLQPDLTASLRNPHGGSWSPRWSGEGLAQDVGGKSFHFLCVGGWELKGNSTFL